MAEFEKSDLTPKLALSLAAGGVLLIAGSALLVMVLRPDAVHDRDLREALMPMEPPALQTDGRGDMRRFRAEELRDLESYGWGGRDKGMAQVPIEAAMERIARDGIPGWPEKAPP